MKVEVVWSSRAEEDLTRQVAYLEAAQGKKAALNYLTKIAEAIEKISDPDKILYQLVDEERSVHRYLMDKHLALYYRVFVDRVELITLFDTRQDPDKLAL